MIFTIEMLTPVLYCLHFGTIFLIFTVRCSNPSSTHSLFQRVKFFKQSCWKVDQITFLYIQKQNTMPMKHCNNKTITTNTKLLTHMNMSQLTTLCAKIRYQSGLQISHKNVEYQFWWNLISTHWFVSLNSHLNFKRHLAQITMSQMLRISGCLISLTLCTSNNWQK